MNTDLMFSSVTCEWATPSALVKAIERKLGVALGLDVCSTRANAKAPMFFTRENDCFTQDWDLSRLLTRAARIDHTAPVPAWWCNPVYGEPEQPCVKPKQCKKQKCVARGHHCTVYQPGCIDFIQYGIEQVQKHGGQGVYLVPARVDTEWFELLFRASSDVLFLKGRIPFIMPDGSTPAPAPFPNAVCRIALDGRSTPSTDIWDWRNQP